MDLEVGDLIDFSSVLSTDLTYIAPTIYCRLNLLNYCQFLKVFLRHRATCLECPHCQTLSTKVEIIKQVIARIVDTEGVFLLAETQK